MLLDNFTPEKTILDIYGFLTFRKVEIIEKMMHMCTQL